MNRHHFCVIMAGGIGTRFWPVSRVSKPKQFLDFGLTGKSFLKATYDRMKMVVPQDNIIIVTRATYADIVREQVPELKSNNLLLEPYGRNTAPCIAYAAYELQKRDPDAIMIATPADHLILDESAFVETMHRALEYATSESMLITLGIEPSCADTNFGYIQVSGGRKACSGDEPIKIKTFTEKPDQQLAEVFLSTGEFLWNSGIFVWQNAVIIEELERYAPEITNLWHEYKDLNSIYADCPRIAIDYAVMEKTDRAMVIPSRFGWADIGTWSSLYEYMAKLDEHGNAMSISGKDLTSENYHSIIVGTNSKKLMAVKGLEDFIVIDTDSVLMVCPRDEQKLKSFLSELSAPGLEDYR